MIKIVGNIENEMPLYEDPYMEDNKIIQCRKQGINGPIFFVANQKTAGIIYKTFKNKLRKEKLNKITQCQKSL